MHSYNFNESDARQFYKWLRQGKASLRKYGLSHGYQKAKAKQNLSLKQTKKILFKFAKNGMANVKFMLELIRDAGKAEKLKMSNASQVFLLTLTRQHPTREGKQLPTQKSRSQKNGKVN